MVAFDHIIRGGVVTCFCAAGANFTTPSMLNGDPSGFDGREIIVRGYISVTPSGHVLYESKYMAEKTSAGFNGSLDQFNPMNYKRECVTIMNPDFFKRTEKHANFHEKTLRATFWARANKDGAIDNGACILPTGVFVSAVVK